MTQLNKISDTPPQFPCWLWDKQARFWWRCESYPDGTALNGYNSHWHPDQPTPPEGVPEPTTHDFPIP